MKIRLGYACISKTLDITSSSTMTYSYYKRVGETRALNKLDSIINSNLSNLEEILKYNIKNNIHFFRMTSNLIPLGTHPNVFIDINKYNEQFKNIGNIIKNNNLRVDIHLDQYYVLNSINTDTVNSTINMLEFSHNIFNNMKIDSKIVLHVGGKVDGKKKGIERFINNFNLLENNIKRMIILENDDKIYNVRNSLSICNKLDIPMVLDYHHFKCNKTSEKIEDYIIKIFDTWKDEIPKIHFSSPKSKKEYRAHHEYIDSDQFIKFIEKIKFVNRDFDIMIEAKGKDEALFRLVRELKYKTNYTFLDETTIIF